MAAFGAAAPGRLLARDLTVGPGQAFARLEEALAQAQPGDVIPIGVTHKNGRFFDGDHKGGLMVLPYDLVKRRLLAGW